MWIGIQFEGLFKMYCYSIPMTSNAMSASGIFKWIILVAELPGKIEVHDCLQFYSHSDPLRIKLINRNANATSQVASGWHPYLSVILVANIPLFVGFVLVVTLNIMVWKYILCHGSYAPGSNLQCLWTFWETVDLYWLICSFSWAVHLIDFMVAV